MNYVMSMSDLEVGNYEVPLVFEYECTTDSSFPSIGDKIEPALIKYHAYVSEQLNQGLKKIAVTVINNETSACVEETRRGRFLRRSLQTSKIRYIMNTRCTGLCPIQLLPSIATVDSNRKLDIGFLPDQAPFLSKFIEIFEEVAEIKVTNSTTNKEETKKICSP